MYRSELLFIIISFFLVGLFLLLSGIKNWEPFKPRGIGRVISEVLGEQVRRVFKILVGSILCIYSLGLLYLGAPKSAEEKELEKTNQVITVMKTKLNSSVVGYGTLESLIERHEILKKTDLKYIETFTKISFKNNYLKKLPAIVLEMENLEEINLTNNLVKRLPVLELKQLKALKKIIITNNPIESSNLDSLKVLLSIEIINEKLK
jgi:hypothetical protein